jgi:hypothetical protein
MQVQNIIKQELDTETAAIDKRTIGDFTFI